jgi:hypothetical protein
MFMTEIASHGDCNDPWALYLNDGLRNKCVSSKQIDELKSHQKQFQNDSTEIKANITKIRNKIQETDDEHEALQAYIKLKNEEKWASVKQTVSDLSGTVLSIKTKYKENAEKLNTLVNDYNTSIATNAELLVQVGNNLVDKLTKNIYTPNWTTKRKTLVDSYNKIVEYITKNPIPKGIEGASENIGSTVPSSLNPLSSDAINGKTQ